MKTTSELTKMATYRFQTVEADVLAAAARGEIDLNALAKQELANRGLNHAGKWVGFAEAERLSKLSYVRGPKGKRIAVSVPED